MDDPDFPVEWRIEHAVWHARWYCDEMPKHSSTEPDRQLDYNILQMELNVIPEKIARKLRGEISATDKLMLASRQSTRAQFEEARLSALRITKPLAAGSRHLDALTAKFDAWFHSGETRVRSECSSFLARYQADIGLTPNDPDVFVRLVKQLSRGLGSGARKPEAFLRRAILREQKRTAIRAKAKERDRMASCDSLPDCKDVASTVVAKIDWDCGMRVCNLSNDQRRAMEAKREGLDLQRAEAADFFSWPPEHLDTIRRSLEPDRSAMKRLRSYFGAYQETSIPVDLLRQNRRVGPLNGGKPARRNRQEQGFQVIENTVQKNF